MIPDIGGNRELFSQFIDICSLWSFKNWEKALIKVLLLSFRLFNFHTENYRLKTVSELVLEHYNFI